MTIWMLIPIIISIAAVLYNYFGLYLKTMDKVADLGVALRKDISDLTTQVAREEMKHDVICNEHSKKLELLSIVDTRQSKMEAQLGVYLKTLDPFLASAIHSPIHVERDTLMDKLKGDTLTYEEAAQLEEELERAIQEEADGNKKWIEVLSLARVRSIKVGYEFDKKSTQMGM